MKITASDSVGQHATPALALGLEAMNGRPLALADLNRAMADEIRAVMPRATSPRKEERDPGALH